MTLAELAKLLAQRASFQAGYDPTTGKTVPGYMVWLSADEMREIDEMAKEVPDATIR